MFGKVESESILESKKPRLKGKILGFGWVRRQLGAGGDRKRKDSGRHGVLTSIESGPSRHEEAGRVDGGVGLNAVSPSFLSFTFTSLADQNANRCLRNRFAISIFCILN